MRLGANGRTLASVQPETFEPAPIDFQQLELLGRLPPAHRVRAMLATENWIRAGLRGTLSKRFPNMSQRELNLRVLAYLTPLRGVTIPPCIRFAPASSRH